MANLPKRIETHLLFFMVLIVVFTNSCVGLIEDTTEETSLGRNESDIFITQEPAPSEIIYQTPAATSDKELNKAREIPVISIANASDLMLQKTIYPFFPEIIHIAAGGHVAAVGDLSGIRVIDLDTDREIMQIDTELPMCKYGMDRYFQFNYDGSFLAVTTNREIQVWQVGSGVVYEAPYKDNHVMDSSLCGADIPQLALSPDGKFLAESGIRFTETDIERYFRIVNIINNTTVYEWDGTSESLHGQFYTFPGLGFSLDGKVLQSFDPLRFNNRHDDFHAAFRFWSVENWHEFDRTSKIISDAYSVGEMRFGVITDDSISVVSKKNGAKLNALDVNGCSWENPCPVKFSPDGSRMVVLVMDENLRYERESISSLLAVFKLSNGDKVIDNSVMMRNLDGLLVKDGGEIIKYDSSPLNNTPKWWTLTEYFAGFKIFDENTVTFTPQVVNYQSQKQDLYSGSCQIQSEDFAVDCYETLSYQEGITLTVDRKDYGFDITDTTSGKEAAVLTKIEIPIGDQDDFWQLRMLEYVWESGVGFYCLDQNFRKATCTIMNFHDNEILHDQIELTGLNYSRKNKTAAFVNEKEKSLYLFDDDSNALKKIRTYRAVSLPISPAFLPVENELIYVVQSLAGPKYKYIERIETTLGKVLKRYDIEGLKAIEITSISVSRKEEIWAAADKSGNVYMIDPEEEAVIQKVPTAKEEIVDIIFTPDGKSLLVMSKSGRIHVLTVK